MADVAGTIASLRTQAELGLMNLPDDHQYVGYGDAATALQTLTDKVEAQATEILRLGCCMWPDDADLAAQHEAALTKALTKEGKSA